MPEQPNMQDLTEAQQRRHVGICCYNILGLLSTAAFICAIYSYAYCDFAKRYITLADGVTAQQACADAGYTGGSQDSCVALLGTHGVGFEGFWATVPVDQQVCFPYTQPTPWGYVTPSFDTKFNSARALSVTGIVLGGAAWFTLMLASCCPIDQAKLKGLSCYFFLACLFQGLSLLIFRSNICDAGFFSIYFDDPNTNVTPDTSVIQSVSCGLSTGSSLAVAATVLYFVCNAIIPSVVVPGPMSMPSYGGDDNDNNGELQPEMEA